MKTAVSIPNGVFEDPQRLARRSGKSRSRLFCEAVGEYAARHSMEEVTGAMDPVCADLGSAPDPFTAGAARRILERTEWRFPRGDVLWADLPARTTGLPRDSVANGSQVTSLDRGLLAEPAGKLSRSKLRALLAGVDVVLGR
jgi:hypothetical protein